VLVEVEIPGRGANRVQVNRSTVRRKRDLRRQVRAVYFGPDDLVIVIADPSKRRDFLDEAIRSLWPLKESAMTAYERTLRQRTGCSRNGRGAAPPGWRPGTSAVKTEARRPPPRRSRDARPQRKEIAPGRYACLQYAPNVPRSSRRRSNPPCRAPGTSCPATTWSAPSRDLTLAVRDLGARSFASHGEAWAAALCLRLGLASAVAEEVRERPVLLLDFDGVLNDPRAMLQQYGPMVAQLLSKAYGRSFLHSLPDCTRRQGRLDDLPHLARLWLSNPTEAARLAGLPPV
jgi:DNA replication and repair protein RecF